MLKNHLNCFEEFRLWDWVGDSDVKDFNGLADSCWVMCAPINGMVPIISAVIAARKMFLFRSLPMILVELCVTDACVSAALAEIRPFGVRSALQFTMRVFVVDRVIWFLGIGVTSAILAGSVALGVFVVFIWKIGNRVQFHFVFLVMLMVSLACQIVFWAFQSSQAVLYSQASVVVSLSTVISTATMFAFMAKDWTMAFVFLVSGKGLEFFGKLPISKKNRGKRKARPGFHDWNHRSCHRSVGSCSWDWNCVNIGCRTIQ